VDGRHPSGQGQGAGVEGGPRASTEAQGEEAGHRKGLTRIKQPRVTSIYQSTHRYTQRFLATKNIAISEESYQRLKALKKPGESFTDVIERVTRTRGVLDLAGVLSISQAKDVSDRIRQSRTESARRLQRAVEKLS